MKTFQFVCAKNGQKTELILQYPTIEEARASLHAQGYTIIEWHELAGEKDIGSQKPLFYFEVVVNSEQKTGKIEADDILKAYIKLKDTLHYDVRAIYANPEATTEQKEASMKQVLHLYSLYRKQYAHEIEERKREIEKQKEAISTPEKQLHEAPKEEDINTSIKREIERYHTLIQKSIDKATALVSTNADVLTAAQKSKLSATIDSLRHARNITNPERLKVIGEEALVLMGTIQKELIDTHKAEHRKNQLLETNQLLRSF